MKVKYLLTGIIAVAMVVLPSCSENLLDIPRKGVLPKSEFYKTDDDALEALAMVYRYVWTATFQNTHGVYPFIKNVTSDDIYSGGQMRNDFAIYEEMNEFTFGSDNAYLLSYFQLLYNFVYRCNLIIDNFTGDNLNTETKKRAVAEAKVWRAWAYTELITMWGTPPLVDHCLTPDEYQQPNGDPEELWNLVVSDLTYAINSGMLLQKKSKSDRITNVTVGYANALLGKAYVFMTYSLSGGALGGEQAVSAVSKAPSSKYWANAVEAFDKVINSNMYELYDGPFVDILKVKTNWSAENLWEFNRMYNSANTATNMTTGFESYAVGFPNACITGFGDVLPCNRASNFMTPRKQAYDAMVAWQGADNQRLYGSIRTYEQLVNDMGVGVKEGVYSFYACDGVFDMKYFRDERHDCITNHATNKHYPLMRYAEVLLLAAEANLMTGNQAKADEYMNIVRKRAGLANMTGVKLSDIQQEKRCELYHEGVRAYDLIRWGLAYENMKDQGAYVGYITAYTSEVVYDANGKLVKLTSTREGTVTVGGVTYTLGIQNHVINESGGYGFKQRKHELFPFPYQEILLSGEIASGPLRQNPGW